jgi:hypothetical protein
MDELFILMRAAAICHDRDRAEVRRAVAPPIRGSKDVEVAAMTRTDRSAQLSDSPRSDARMAAPPA